MPGRRRIRKVLFWGLVFFLVGITGAMGFAYAYVTDGATLAALIRQEAPRYVPGSVLELGRVQWRPLLGQVTLNQVRLVQPLDGEPFRAAQVAWLNVRFDFRELVHGRFAPTEVSVATPVLRLRRRRDGTWNLQGLLADPWPAPALERQPVLHVRNGTLELIDRAGEPPVMLLRDVDLVATPAPGSSLVHLEATARGGPFDRVRLEGSLDCRSGRVELIRGELGRLELSDSLGRCLPGSARARFTALGLSGGEVDLACKALRYDPEAPGPERLRCAGAIEVRGAALDRPRDLPFPLTGVDLRATFTQDALTIEHAQGRNGKTLVKLRGTIAAPDPARGPFDLHAEVTDLELDSRLRAKTPPELQPLWDEYRPEGWIHVGLNLARRATDAPIGFGLTVGCADVGLTYRLFPYPIQHAQGTLTWQGERLTIDLRALIGGDWASCKGTVDRPGPDALVQLDFAGRSVPLDETLLNALPPDIREVVAEFHPSGSARGTVHLTRRPPDATDPNGPVEITAELDANEGCAIRWDGLPYPVQDLTGHLQIQPNRWTFTDMKGRNGTATIAADGQVRKIGRGIRDIAATIHLHAEHLPFEQQLRNALPEQWQATWATLNPSGFSRVDADIEAVNGQEPHYHLKIVPEPAETRIQLVLAPPQGAPAPARAMTLPPMETVAGTFLYDDGTITMTDTLFVFREAPVRFKRGKVIIGANGAFRLGVEDLLVTKLRLDAELRRRMPPVMAQFAQRLDDGKSFWIRGDLGIAWSGQPGAPARCDWRNATLVLNGNTIQSGVPLEQLQGQVDNVRGSSDGLGIELRGVVRLASVRLLGQQITELETPLMIADGRATLGNIQAKLLGGKVFGAVALSLDATPHYHADLQLVGADLSRYAVGLPGQRTLRGVVSGRLAVEGKGNDVRTCVGDAQATVIEGDLGQLPQALRWMKVPNFRPPTRTAFDTASLHATIGDGRATFDKITFTGDAFTLSGAGTVQLQGDRWVDLHFSPHYGRDERHIPLIGEAVREASTRMFDIHATGPLASPTIRPEPLPEVLSRAGAAMRRMGERRQERPARGQP